MNEQELREGLALAIWPALEWGGPYQCADAVIAYLRQHDGHAEFVRAVHELATDGITSDVYLLERIAELCAAELAKEH